MRDAIFRQRLADNPDVLRTWFEWELDSDTKSNTIVIEVALDTDPNSPKFDPSALARIEETIANTLAHPTAMIAGRARIVPRGIY